MSYIRLTNVNKTYDKGVRAANDLSLEIRDREFHVLVGPSGCGKSTLLRLIAGLEKADSGRILMDGMCINDLPPADRNVAMVFQNFSLYPHLTVFKNIAFGLQVRGADSEEIEKKVNDIAEILGLRDVLYRKPRELSGGQRQRVALGRALVREPGVFLLDEPFSNIDGKLRKELRDELVRIRQRIAGTFLYVTHDIGEAMVLGDRISVMRDGKIVQTATPAVLYDEPCDSFVCELLGKKEPDGKKSVGLADNRISAHIDKDNIVIGNAGAEVSLSEPILNETLRDHLIDIARKKMCSLSFSADAAVLHEIPDALSLCVEIKGIEEKTGFVNVRAVLKGSDDEVRFRTYPNEKTVGVGMPEIIYVSFRDVSFCDADGMRLNTYDTVFSNDYYVNGEKKHLFADSVEVVLPTVKKTLFGKKLVQAKGDDLIFAQAYGSEQLGGTPEKTALFLHLPSLNADAVVLTDKKFSVYDMPEMMIRKK